MNSNKIRRNYTLTVKSSKGKVLDTREVARNSQWGAHNAARGFFRSEDRAVGTTMDVVLNGKAIEKFTMNKDGWDFEVLNGESVLAASRALNGVKVTAQKPTTKAKARTTKPASKTRKPATRKAAVKVAA